MVIPPFRHLPVVTIVVVVIIALVTSVMRNLTMPRIVNSMKTLLRGVCRFILSVTDRVLARVLLITTDGTMCSGLVVVNGTVFLETKDVLSSYVV